MDSFSYNSVSVYVSTYEQYEEGGFRGKWFPLKNYKTYSDFIAVCKKLHSKEENPRWMFPDYGNIPKQFINQSWINPEIFNIIQLLSEDEYLLFLEWCDYGYDMKEKNAEEIISAFRASYIGEFDNDTDFAVFLIGEAVDKLPTPFNLYFDYSSFAQDKLINDCWCINNHYYSRRI